MVFSNDGLVRVYIEGAKAVLEICRPEALNALNREVLEGVERAALALAARADVSVVVLQGAGEKAFVAGADIREMASLSPTEAQEFSILGSRAFAAIANLPQIVIAKVQGFALGGGLELALSADFILCSEKAVFGFPEVSLGLIPGFGGTQRFARRVGEARALEWIASGDKYKAKDIENIGLVNAICATEELDSRVEKIVGSILSRGPAAVRAAKRTVQKGLETSLHAGCQLESAEFGLRFGTSESKEGMTAFVEKRQPVFR